MVNMATTYNTTEAAKLLGITRRAVQSMIARQVIKSATKGPHDRDWSIPASEVDRVIKARREYAKQHPGTQSKRAGPRKAKA